MWKDLNGLFNDVEWHARLGTEWRCLVLVETRAQQAYLNGCLAQSKMDRDERRSVRVDAGVPRFVMPNTHWVWVYHSQADELCRTVAPMVPDALLHTLHRPDWVGQPTSSWTAPSRANTPTDVDAAH